MKKARAIISLFFMFSVFLVLTRISVEASDSDNLTLFIGGNLVDSSGELTGTMPDGVSYDSSTNTLTLNNCNVTSNNASFIKAYGELNICLIGDNTCTYTGDGYSITGIYSSGKLTITGDGSLTLDFSKYNGRILAIEARKILDIESCTINLIGSESGSAGYFYGLGLEPWRNLYGGLHDDCYIQIKDATVYISNTVNSSENYAYSWNVGIDAQDADLKIINSKVDIRVKNGVACGLLTGLYDDDGERAWGGKLTIDEASWIIFEGIDATSCYATYHYDEDIKANYIYVGDSIPGKLKAKDKAFSLNLVRTECTASYMEISPHKWDAGTITKKAKDCKHFGTIQYKCTLCGVTKDEAINGEHSYKTTIKKATKSKSGKIVEKCSTCGDVRKSTTIAKIKSVTLSASSYTYDGKAKKPKVTVKDSNGKKIASSNYKVTYSNNKKVGKATVTIKFKGNYSGTIKKTFTIKAS